MSVSAELFQICHDSSAVITEEMPAKEFCPAQLDYHIWLFLLIRAVLYYLYLHNLW